MLAGNGDLAGGAWFGGGGGAGGHAPPGPSGEEGADDGDDPAPREGEDDAAYAARLQATEDRANFLALAGLQGPPPAGLAAAGEGEGEAGAGAAPAPALDLLAGTDTSALSYEQLNALGDIAGTGPRGADPGAVAALPVEVFGGEGGSGGGCPGADDGAGGCCVVCQCDYERGDRLTVLPCGHRYHETCAAEALAARKVCPLCGKEVEA